MLISARSIRHRRRGGHSGSHARRLRRRALLQRLEPRWLLAADANQPPGVTGTWLDLDPSQSHAISVADLGYSDPEDDPLVHVTIESTPALGSLQLYDSPVPSGTIVSASDLQFGYLVYVPEQSSSSYSSSFTFTASDGYGDSASATIGFNVAASSTAPPSVSGSMVTLAQDQSHTISLADLGYSDPQDLPLESITILSPPTYGTLQYDGSPIYSQQTIYRYELDAGYLVYQPDPHASSSYNAALTFTASNGVVESSSATLGLHVDVTPNSPPSVSGSVITLASGQSYTISIDDLGYEDPDGDPPEWITIVSAPSYGTLDYYGFPLYSGQMIDRHDIEAGYISYQPDPYSTTAHYDSFEFTASDGQATSLGATMHFQVNGSENTPPTTADIAVAVPAEGSITLQSSHFPFEDADGDSLDHVTILSVPSSASLTYYGSPVSAGQTIDVYSLDTGALQLSFPESASTGATALVSFSVSDGIDSSASAVLAATLEGSENQRPTTTSTAIQVPSGDVHWLTLDSFPYQDPDDDPISHATIHAVPSGVSLVDADGHSYPVPLQISEEELAEGKIGLTSDAEPGDEFAIVFSVSDGDLDSTHAVLSMTVVDPELAPHDDGRIEIIPWQGPVVTLAGGFSPRHDTAPSAAHISDWLGGADGQIEHHGDDAWTYTETYQAESHLWFDQSLAYVFVASGVGSTLLGYSLEVTGVGGDPEPSPHPDEVPALADVPWNAPLPDQPNSLDYTLAVDLDDAGEIDQLTIAGDLQLYEYFAAVDVPLGTEIDFDDWVDEEQLAPQDDDPDPPPEDDSDADEADVSGTFTIIIAAWSDLSFDSLGVSGLSGVQSFFGYNLEGDYQYDPLGSAIGPDPEDSAADDQDDTDAEDPDDDGDATADDDAETDDDDADSSNEGEETSSDEPEGSGLVSGTFSLSGSHFVSLQADGRLLLDGTPDPLTIHDQWFDVVEFEYEGDGSYTIGPLTGTIIEHGSETLIGDGSMTLVAEGDDHLLTGDFSVTAFGHDFYEDSWQASIDSDEDGITLVGESWGSFILDDSYHVHFDFEVQPVDQQDDGDDGAPDDPDLEPESDAEEDPLPYQWVFVSGSFDFDLQISDSAGYQADGTYQSTAGVAADPDGGSRQLHVPISGTIQVGGNDVASITFSAAGTLTADDVQYDHGTLHLIASSDDFVTIDASGTISSDGLNGQITLYDHFESDYLRQVSFDLTDPDAPGVGHGHDYVLVDTQFDQTAVGTIDIGELSGDQWADVTDHFFLEISVDYEWSDDLDASSDDDDSHDEEPGDGEDPADDDPENDDPDDGPSGDGDQDETDDAATTSGWVSTAASLLLIADNDFDIGYDVTGTIEQDGLEGQASQHAYETGFGFTELEIDVSEDKSEDYFSFSFIQSFENHFEAGHDLSGDYTSEPLSPSEAVLSGTAWENVEFESTLSIFMSVTMPSAEEQDVIGVLTISEYSLLDQGHSASGPYERTDGDTTFSGSASLEQSLWDENRVNLIFSFDNEGTWKLGPPIAAHLTYPENSEAVSLLEVDYHHSYEASGTIASAEDDAIQWNPAESEASESGLAEYSLRFLSVATPSEAPPDDDAPDDDATDDGDAGDGGTDDPDGQDDSDAEGDASEDAGDNTDDAGDSDEPSESDSDQQTSPLPALTWSYDGHLITDSTFLAEFERSALGQYESATLAGTISESFNFIARSEHDEAYEILHDGELRQTEGEASELTSVSFDFNLDLAGDIDADHEHSGGLAGEVKVQNTADGQFAYQREDNFTPGPLLTSGQGTWQGFASSLDHFRFQSTVTVELSGTVGTNIGGQPADIEIDIDTLTHSSGLSLQRFIMAVDGTEDKGPGVGSDDWLQVVGTWRTRDVSRDQQELSGENDLGSYSEETDRRTKHRGWEQLLAPETVPGEGQWGEGGRSRDDYDFQRLDQHELETPLNIPMSLIGESLQGAAYENSFDSMSVKSRQGEVFGDGANPPWIDPELLNDDPEDLLGFGPLPTQAGSARGPISDGSSDGDGDGGGGGGGGSGGDDWDSDRYGQLVVQHQENSAAGFHLVGSYTIDGSFPGAGSMIADATVQHTISNHQGSEFEFELRSKMDSETGSWENTSGTRFTASESEQENHFKVDGGWVVDNGIFALTGTFHDEQRTYSDSQNSSLHTLDPSSGQWSTVDTHGFTNMVTVDRGAGGSGDYSHDRYGFDVSGDVTVGSSFFMDNHHSVDNVRVDGVLSPESHGERYELTSSSQLVDFDGAGGDSVTTPSSQPLYIGTITQPFQTVQVGTRNTTVTVDRLAEELKFRDISHSDRTDYAYDSATGTLEPSLRTVVDSNASKDERWFMIDTQSESGGSGEESIDGLTYSREVSYESQQRREQLSTHESDMHRTEVHDLTAPGADPQVTWVGGWDSERTLKTLIDIDNDSQLEIIGENQWGEPYEYREQSKTERERRTRDTVQRWGDHGGGMTEHLHGWINVEGPGDTWIVFEKEGDEVLQDIHYVESPQPEEDEPDSYDATIESDPDDSTSMPTEDYLEPYETDNLLEPAPQPPTGPGAVVPPELPAGVAELESDVSEASMQAADTAEAHDAAIEQLAEDAESLGEQSLCDDTDGDCDELASEGEFDGSASAVAESIAEAMPLVPTADPGTIADEAASEAAGAGEHEQQNTGGFFSKLRGWFFGDGEPSAAARNAAERKQATGAAQQSHGLGALRQEMGLVNGKRASRAKEAAEEFQAQTFSGLPGAGMVEASTGYDGAGRELGAGERALAGLTSTLPFLAAMGGPARSAGKSVVKDLQSSGAAKLTKAPKGGYLRDFQTPRTIKRDAFFSSEGQARQLAREKVGHNAVVVEANKLRSVDGRWQYRAKPIDTTNNHVHIERLDPTTGEVLENWHLYWPEGASR